MSTTTEEEQRREAEAIAQQFQKLRETAQTLQQRIASFDAQRAEHRLVVDQLQKLDPGRKCFRLVQGVLLERQAGEVLPAVEEKLSLLEATVSKLRSELEEVEGELIGMQQKYNIKPSTGR